MKCAAAALVSTPGLSLTGSEASLRFHTLCSRATQAALSHASLLTGGELLPIWAVAEPTALKHRLWNVFPAIAQGEGSEAERLHRVQAALLARSGLALVIRAGFPQLTAQTIVSALDLLERSGADHVVGPGEKGGFYLVASRSAIPAQAWERGSFAGKTEKLPTLASFDSPAASLAQALESIPSDSRSHEQGDLLRWLGNRTT